MDRRIILPGEPVFLLRLSLGIGGGRTVGVYRPFDLELEQHLCTLLSEFALIAARTSRARPRDAGISILNGPLFGQVELRMSRATRFVNLTESNYMNLPS